MAGGSGANFSQAGKQQAAANAGRLPAAAGKAPFWAWWGSEVNKHSNSTKTGAQQFLSRFHGNAKGFQLPKFEMPVHVDVDFMTPFVTSVKKASRDVWLQLPPPVRQAAPYLAKNKVLEQRLEVLTTERDDAKILAKELKSQTSRPQGASEMQMVAAVSQATRAAAEAATAAAGAAAICIIDPRAHASRPAKAASRRSSKRAKKQPASSLPAQNGDIATAFPAPV